MSVVHFKNIWSSKDGPLPSSPQEKAACYLSKIFPRVDAAGQKQIGQIVDCVLKLPFRRKPYLEGKGPGKFSRSVVVMPPDKENSNGRKVFLLNRSSLGDPILGKGSYKRYTKGVDLLSGDLLATGASDTSLDTEISALEFFDGQNHFIKLLASVDYPSNKHKGRMKQRLVVPWYEGGDLERFVRRHKLSPEQKKVIFTQLVEAVAISHENKMLLRDLKLANVVVRDLGGEVDVALTDLGMVCRFDDKDSLSSVCGTPMHLPPELAKLLAKQYNAKSTMDEKMEARGEWGKVIGYQADAWALGKMLFEIYQGSSLFKVLGVDPGSTIFQTAEMIDNLGKRRIFQKPLPNTVAEVIFGLLQPDPQKRMSAKEAWFKIVPLEKNDAFKEIRLHLSPPSSFHDRVVQYLNKIQGIDWGDDKEDAIHDAAWKVEQLTPASKLYYEQISSRLVAAMFPFGRKVLLVSKTPMLQQTETIVPHCGLNLANGKILTPKEAILDLKIPETDWDLYDNIVTNLKNIKEVSQGLEESEIHRIAWFVMQLKPLPNQAYSFEPNGKSPYRPIVVFPSDAKALVLHRRHSGDPVLAHGGYKEVSPAWDLVSGKRLSAVTFSDPEKKIDFEKELLLLKHLEGNPDFIQLLGNIVFLGKQLHNSAPMAIFPSYEDGNLQSAWSKASEKEKASFFSQLIRMVAQLHKNGMVYRNIKSRSILIEATPSGRKLVFSNVSSLQGLNAATHAGNLHVNTRFLAPEVGAILYEAYQKGKLTISLNGMLKMPGEYTNRVKEKLGPANDVWALGVACFTDKNFPDWFPNFKGKGIEEIILSTLHDLSQKKEILVEPAKGTVKHLLWRMLRPNPSDRISMNQALQELERLEKEGGFDPGWTNGSLELLTPSPTGLESLIQFSLASFNKG